MGPRREQQLKDVCLLTLIEDGVGDHRRERHHELARLVALDEHLEAEPHGVQVDGGRLQPVVEAG